MLWVQFTKLTRNEAVDVEGKLPGPPTELAAPCDNHVQAWHHWKKEQKQAK